MLTPNLVMMELASRRSVSRLRKARHWHGMANWRDAGYGMRLELVCNRDRADAVRVSAVYSRRRFQPQKQNRKLCEGA